VNVAFVFDPAAAAPTATLELARALAAGDAGGPWVAACVADPALEPRRLVAALGAARAALVVDPALAAVGPRGRAQTVGALLRPLSVDLVLLDGASDGDGLLVAALAAQLGAIGLGRVSAVERAAGSDAEVVVDLRLGGQRRRLRVRLPAVLSLAPPARPLAPPPPAGEPELRVLDLAALGLEAGSLIPEPMVPARSPFVPAKPRFVTDVAPLLRRDRA
jgi:electron transfer flavoprotein alpha/beta subunit